MPPGQIASVSQVTVFPGGVFQVQYAAAPMDESWA